MLTKGIRGAISVSENSVQEIENSVEELLSEMISKNSIERKMISHVIFTLTDDLNAVFPAKAAREKLGWNDVAMMCFNELKINGAIEKCLRVLIVLNCENDFIPRHVYLKGAKILREDFS